MASVANVYEPGLAARLRPRGGSCVTVGQPEVVATIADMQLEQLSDEALIANHRSAVGTPQAEEYANELFRRHHLKVARWCLRFTSDRESAADLAQEICAKAYRNLSSFQGSSKFSTWLYSIARNHCMNELRARSARPELETDEGIFEGIADQQQQSPEQAAIASDSVKIVRELLNEALDETEKAVYTLHYGDELPLDAITRMLGLTNASGAKAYVVSARRKLARSVERWKARSKRTMQ